MSHLHFVQSIDAKRGGGLGIAAIALNAWTNKSGTPSLLATAGTRNELTDNQTVMEPAVGPQKFFFSPGLRRVASQLVRESSQVHGHGFYTYLNWLFGSEARRQRKPFCYHIHGIFDPYILQRSRIKKRVVGWLFEDANYKYTRLWRALTLKEVDQARALGIKARIEVLPNGIDLDAVPQSQWVHLRRDWYRADGRRVLLFLGRLHEKKGIDMLLDAFAKLAPQHPDWLLAIVGPDENGQLQRLQQIVSDYSLQDRVRFCGAVWGEEKQFALASADAFVLPSLSEGMPVAVLEAAAARLPLLITTECNLPEFGGDGGAIVCAPTRESISRGLAQLLAADASELSERSAQAISVVRQHFNWPVIIQRWLEICREL